VFGIKTKDLQDFTTSKKNCKEFSRMPNDNYLYDKHFGDKNEVLKVKKVHERLRNPILALF
jgi:hypothetical protein